MIDVNTLIGSHDVLFITLDALRFDVAQRCLRDGRTPNLARLLPVGVWEERHSPGNFTLAAHQAFFAGFLPTPVTPGKHPRLFALRFPGSETTVPETCVFDAPDIVAGFAERGYHTACIGGVGFFNKATPLGRVLPSLFAESHWRPEFGVTEPRSTENQVACAAQVLGRLPRDRRVFLFLNVAAIHQPNRFYVPGAAEDSLETHAAALAYVDGQVAAAVPPPAATGAGVLHRLFRPWHGLRRGRLLGASREPSGGLDRSVCRLPLAQARP